MTPEQIKQGLAQRLLAQCPNTTDINNQKNKDVALQAANLFFEQIISSKSRYKQLNALVATFKKDQTIFDKVLKQVFLDPKFNIMDFSQEPIQFNDQAEKNIKFNVFLAEKALLDDVAQNQVINKADREAQFSRLQRLAEKGQVIPQNAWLDGADHREALEQLAQENSAQAQEIRAVEVTDVGRINKGPKTYLKQSLERVKASDKANLILNTGKHFVQVHIVKNNAKAEVTITNSLASDLNDVALQEQMKKELAAVYGRDNFILHPTNFTANQAEKNGWSCGYRALAATAQRLGIKHGLASNLDKNVIQNEADFSALRDWTFKLVIGQSSKDYHESLASDISLGTLDSDYSKPMLAPTVNWIKDHCAKDATATSGANNKYIKIENNDKSVINVRRKCVDATNTKSLDPTAKRALANKMIKIYIAGKMGLKDNQPFPSKAEIAKAGIRGPVIKGKDEELKRLMKQELSKLSGLGPSVDVKPSRPSGPRR